MSQQIRFTRNTRRTPSLSPDRTINRTRNRRPNRTTDTLRRIPRLTNLEAAALIRHLYSLPPRPTPPLSNPLERRFRTSATSHRNHMPNHNHTHVFRTTPPTPSSSSTISEESRGRPEWVGRPQYPDSALPQRNEEGLPPPQHVFFDVAGASAGIRRSGEEARRVFEVRVGRDEDGGSRIIVDATARVHGHMNAVSIPAPAYVLSRAEELEGVVRGVLEAQRRAVGAVGGGGGGEGVEAGIGGVRLTIQIDASVTVIGSRNQIIMSARGDPPGIITTPMAVYGGSGGVGPGGSGSGADASAGHEGESKGACEGQGAAGEGGRAEGGGGSGGDGSSTDAPPASETQTTNTAAAALSPGATTSLNTEPLPNGQDAASGSASTTSDLANRSVAPATSVPAPPTPLPPRSSPTPTSTTRTIAGIPTFSPLTHHTYLSPLTTSQSLGNIDTALAPQSFHFPATKFPAAAADGGANGAVEGTVRGAVWIAGQRVDASGRPLGSGIEDKGVGTSGSRAAKREAGEGLDGGEGGKRVKIEDQDKEGIIAPAIVAGQGKVDGA